MTIKSIYVSDDIANRPILEVLYDNIEKELHDIKIRNANFSDYDFGATINYFPLDDDNILAILHCINDEIINAFNQTPNIKQYNYNDNTDRPKGIKLKEWKRREANWNYVLGGNGYGIISNNSFQYTLLNIDLSRNTKFRIDNIIESQPSFDYRCKKATKSLYIEKYIKEKQSEDNTLNSVDLYFKALYSIKTKPTKYIETLEYVEKALTKKIDKDILENAIYIKYD